MVTKLRSGRIIHSIVSIGNITKRGGVYNQTVEGLRNGRIMVNGRDYKVGRESFDVINNQVYVDGKLLHAESKDEITPTRRGTYGRWILLIVILFLFYTCIHYY
jgi:hypothetical protein